MKKISVIIPVYNAEKYLKRCVDSVREQTYGNLEIILVDDGSPDECPQMCDTFATEDDRIKVIHKKNAGVAAARNTGLDAAVGEYLTFVDSDDYIDSNMYQSMIKIVEDYNCDVVMCDCVKEFNDRKEIYTHDIREGYYNRKQIESEYFPHLLMMPNVEYPPTISNCLCLFRNNKSKSEEFEKKLRYEEGIRFSEDLLFGAELIYQADSFYYMKEQCFYHYWINPKSATHTFAPDKWNDYRKLYKKIFEKFSKCPYYDFLYQIDLVLLFFVYNAIGDIRVTQQLSDNEKYQKCKRILQEKAVRQMFSRLKISQLPISKKLKIITFIYKYGIGIDFLIRRG